MKNFSNTLLCEIFKMKLLFSKLSALDISSPCKNPDTIGFQRIFTFSNFNSGANSSTITSEELKYLSNILSWHRAVYFESAFNLSQYVGFKSSVRDFRRRPSRAAVLHEPRFLEAKSSGKRVKAKAGLNFSVPKPIFLSQIVPELFGTFFESRRFSGRSFTKLYLDFQNFKRWSFIRQQASNAILFHPRLFIFFKFFVFLSVQTASFNKSKLGVVPLIFQFRRAMQLLALNCIPFTGRWFEFKHPPFSGLQYLNFFTKRGQKGSFLPEVPDEKTTVRHYDDFAPAANFPPIKVTRRRFMLFKSGGPNFQLRSFRLSKRKFLKNEIFKKNWFWNNFVSLKPSFKNFRHLSVELFRVTH